MFYLLGGNIASNFNDAKDVDSLFTIPDGMTKEETETFLRVLKAKKPDEIKDITTEEIVKLLYLVSDLAPHIGQTSIFDNSCNKFKQTLLTSKPLKRRRVL